MVKSILKAMCMDGYSTQKVANSLNISKTKAQSLLIRNNLKTKYAGAFGECGRKTDVLSPFRYFVTEAKGKLYKKKKTRKKEFDITPEYLKEVWDKQKGICSYSKQKMELTTSMKRKEAWGRKSLRTASLDRIDPSKGYIRGNVEFVCIPINLAKNTYTKTETMEFFDAIRDTEKDLVDF